MVQSRKCLSVFAFLLLLCGGCFHREVVVDSSPPGAAVWRGEQLLGAAPQRVKVARKGSVRLRISHPGCIEESVTLKGTEIPEDGRLLVRLSPRPTFSLTCTSDPTGAKVFLDGEYQVETPLKIAPLQPGTVELVFRAKDREQLKRVVELNAEIPNPTVTVKLKSTVERYYRQQIEASPLELANYVDLAHHLVLEKEFEQAIAVFEQAIRTALNHPDLSTHRLWSEVQRVVTRQYAYGEEADVKRARHLMREMLERVFKSQTRDNHELYVNYIQVLDAVGDRRKARELFAVAWKKYPRSRQLKRMKRRLHFR